MMIRNSKRFLVSSNRFFNDPVVSPPPPPPVSPPPPAPTPEPQNQPAPTDMEIPPQFAGRTTFSQAEVNTIFAHNRRNLQNQQRALAEKLQNLQTNMTLTQEQRDTLTAEIEQLRSQYTTKEQQAAADLTRAQKKYETDTRKLQETSDQWKGRFENTIKQNDIMSAAGTHGAFSARQIEAILMPLTTVQEEIVSGQPTGRFVSQVDFPGKDKDGKTVQLKLSPADAVKMMKEMPEEYGNLFRNDANGGLGGNPAPAGQTKNLNVDGMSHADYLKNRTQILQNLSKT